MELKSKLIRLFLVEGNPEGLKTAEISNMTIQATIFPRPQTKLFLQRDEAQKPAVYILLGSDVKTPDESIMYIGQGDPVESRIKQHSRNKDFWDQAIVFCSKDDYLSRTQIKYLEAALYGLASEAHRAKMDNSQVPSMPNISEVDKAEVTEFLEAIRLILSSLGITVLEPRAVHDPVPSDERRIFELSVKPSNENKPTFARMSIIDNKYVVLRGSTAVLMNRPSCPQHIDKLRRDLIESKLLVTDGEGRYLFSQNTAFDSPSYAAAIVVGGSANGRRRWKYNGKSLRQLDEDDTAV